MSSRIQGFSPVEAIKLSRVLSTVTKTYANPYQDIHSMRLSLGVLEEHTMEDPDNELIKYALFDFYFKLGYLEDALEAAEDAFTINPTNPRNRYSVATIYYTLVLYAPDSAIATGNIREIQSLMNQAGNSPSWVTDIINQAPVCLERFGLSREMAAVKAAKYFMEVLNLKLSKQERHHVSFLLQTLGQIYPNILPNNFDIDYNEILPNVPVWYHVFMLARIAFACILIGLIAATVNLVVNGGFDWNVVTNWAIGVGLFYGIPATIHHFRVTH